MSRYAVRPRSFRVRASWDDDVPLLPSLSVDDHEAVDTGLVTHTGEPIMRLPNPVGFHKVGGSAF